MKPQKNFYEICCRAIVAVLIIGTLLNLINQGDAIFGAGDVNVAKLLLTYLAPFVVSVHGALAAKSRMAPKGPYAHSVPDEVARMDGNEAKL